MNDAQEMMRLAEVCFPSWTRDDDPIKPCMLCWAMIPTEHPLAYSMPPSPIYGLTATQAMHVGFHVITNGQP